MKKQIALILALLLILICAGCGQTQEPAAVPSTDAPTQPPSTTEPVTEPTTLETIPPFSTVDTAMFNRIRDFVLENGTLSDNGNYYSYLHKTDLFVTNLNIQYNIEEQQLQLLSNHLRSYTNVYAVCVFLRAGDVYAEFTTQHATTDNNAASGVRTIKGVGTLDLYSFHNQQQATYSSIIDDCGYVVSDYYAEAFSNRIHGVLAVADEFLNANDLGSLHQLGFHSYAPLSSFGDLEYAIGYEKAGVDPNNLMVGQTVSLPDKCEFTVESVEFTSKFSQEIGGWTHSMEVTNPDNIFLVVKLKLTNYSTEPIKSFTINTSYSSNHGLGTKNSMVFNDKYNYDGRFTFFGNSDIVPLGSGTVYAYFEVPQVVKSGTGPIVVNLDIMDEMFIMNIR